MRGKRNVGDLGFASTERTTRFGASIAHQEDTARLHKAPFNSIRVNCYSYLPRDASYAFLPFLHSPSTAANVQLLRFKPFPDRCKQLCGASQKHIISPDTSNAASTTSSGTYADPDFLTEALDILADRSLKSVPNLNSQARKIIAILKMGEENDENLSGIARFQGIVERMNNSVEKVRTSDSKQRMQLDKISAMINFVETGLAMESSSTSSTPLPLAVFLNSQPNTLFDTHMSEMYTAVVALELLARPELQRPAVPCHHREQQGILHNRPKHHQIGEIFFQQPRYERGSSREVRGYGADIDTSLFNLWYRTRCVVFG